MRGRRRKEARGGGVPIGSDRERERGRYREVRSCGADRGRELPGMSQMG